MKTSLKITILLLVVALASACNDMNDSIDKFMADGERLYVGKVDSVKTFAGKNRFMVSFYLKDPRVDTLAVYWNQKKDSILMPILPHSADSLYKINVGGGTFDEGNFVLQFVSRSKSKFNSMLVEGSVNVYGVKYQAKIAPRYYNKTANSSYRTPKNMLYLYFGTAANQTDLGVMLRFFNKKMGIEKDTFIIADTITASNKRLGYLIVKNIIYDKATKPVSYQTLFRPEATAIDTFYTKRDTIQTIKPVAF